MKKMNGRSKNILQKVIILNIFNIITFCKIFFEEEDGRSKNIFNYKSIKNI